MLENARVDGSLIFGILLLTIASIAWAAGSLYSRSTETKTSLHYLISMQAIAGGTLLMFVAGVSGEWEGFLISQVSYASIMALGYLVLFGTIIAYSTYVWLMKVGNPTRVGTYAYVNPVIALLLGSVFASERISLWTIGCSLFILLAVFLIISSKKKSMQTNILSEESLDITTKTKLKGTA